MSLTCDPVFPCFSLTASFPEVLVLSLVSGIKFAPPLPEVSSLVELRARSPLPVV